MGRVVRTVLVTCLSCVAPVGAQDPSGSAALAKLQKLAGEWEGSLEWTGARTSTGRMNASYYVTGGGSAVVENLTNDGTAVMTSVYHMDGSDLRMTHYCAAQNQPRLRAQHIDMDHGVVEFRFLDATNLVSPESPHVQGLEIRFLDTDHITLTFTFVGAGRESHERIDLRRIPPIPSAPRESQDKPSQPHRPLQAHVVLEEQEKRSATVVETVLARSYAGRGAFFR
jgi:hypothetical protein